MRAESLRCAEAAPPVLLLDVWVYRFPSLRNPKSKLALITFCSAESCHGQTVHR